MMTNESDNSLSEEVTFADAAKRRVQAEVSLGDQRTLGGDGAGLDTVIDDIEVVDLEARYKAEGTLGQGGMGAVLLATDTRLERKVAIKRILGEAAGNKIAVQRFLTEAKSIAAINHPNIVQIYDYGRAKDGPFLIMEYVDGGSLLDRCREGPIPLADAIAIACHICDGLARAHDSKIIHRDIKPANILLTKDGIPKLTDFGLAKAQASDRGRTMTGAVLGTPDFMPPEQQRDAAHVDHRSDLWSLAATFYQMITGKSPKVIQLRGLPEAVQDILGRALEDSEDARYQSARELRDALKSATGGMNAATKAAFPVAVVDDELQDGQCNSCGTINADVGRKFCKKCGGALRVPCLKCEVQIPVWDTICGECGGNQPALVAERRASLSAQQAKAEELAVAFAFDEATASVIAMTAESRPEFSAFATWAKKFIESTTEERDRVRGATKKSFEEAQQHATACDYPAAIHALETIPEQFHDAAVVSLLKQCQTRHAEAEALIADIAERVKRKELSGLLPLVERAAVLRQDRQDLSRILGQLRERRDGAIARAREGLASGDAKRALAAFAGMAVEEFAVDDRELFEQVQKVGELDSRVVDAVAAAKSVGVVTPEEAADLFCLCQQYWRLNPRNESIRSLAAQCRGKARLVLAARGALSRDESLALPAIENSLGIKLKLLPAGRFTMGEQGGDSNELPHEVTLSRPFYIGVYEVTNFQWQRVMGSVPSKWKDADRPVESVSWEEAVAFCRKLSELPEERKAGRVYRLPMEAEWEYACRAGTDTKYSFGQTKRQLGKHGWYAENSESQTHPVGEKQPNGWGLYDMHGNVWEWCSDWYGEYSGGEVTDPQGPSGGSFRVIRGGCWYSSAWLCRSALRNGYDPARCNINLGFRLALSPSGASPPEAGE